MTGLEEEATDFQPPSPEPQNDPVYAFAAAPGSEIVFAGRASGLYRSPDAGLNWFPVLESPGVNEPAPVVALAVSPSFSLDQTVMAGMPGAALRSTDGGASWQMLPFPSPAPYLTALAFSPGYLENGEILAGAAEDGFLRSTNGGDDWRYWNFGLLDLEILCLAISPRIIGAPRGIGALAFERAATVFVGTGSGLFRSANGGLAWKELKLPCGHVPVLSLAAGSGERIFAGTEGHGLFYSQDHGKSWSPVGSGRLAGAINMLLASDEAQGLSLGALVDGEMLVSTDHAATWQRVRFRLPAAGSALPGGQRQITAVFPPAGFGLDRPLFVGLETGEIIRLELLRAAL